MAKQHFSRSFRTDSTPGVSPYSASSHSRYRGIGKSSLAKSSLIIYAPLFLIGLFVVAAIAGGSTANSSRQSATTSDLSPVTATATVPATPPVSQQVAQSTNTNLNVSTTVSGSSTPDSTVKSQVTINGKSVPVPTNGTVSQTVTNPDGSTSSFSVSNDTQGDNSSYTSTNLDVSSSSFNGSSSTGFTDTNGQTTVWSTP